MRPRFASDYRTLFWAYVLFPFVPAAGLLSPGLIAWLWPIVLYLSYCAGVVTHNQVHCPVFESRRANRFHAMWLSVFYGCPIAFWIPTHLGNHHQHRNGSADVTRTDRRGKAHDAWQALSYTLACGAWQLPLVLRYVRHARRQAGRAWQDICLQIASILMAHASLLCVASVQHGLFHGTLAYLAMFGLPALLAPNFMLFTNYLQHVHCDAASTDHHSRNFVNPLANWLTFQAGYHTVHHEHPAVHWSRYPALHARRAPAIDPSLNVSSVARFCLDNYLLHPLGLKPGTRSLG
jgi:fatty acid desaturase